jgi:hypothetical protein
MAVPDQVNKPNPVGPSAEDQTDLPEEATRLGLPLLGGYSKRNPHKPRVEARPFGSVPIPRSMWIPPTAGFGPRTIQRGPDAVPTGTTVPPGALGPRGVK